MKLLRPQHTPPGYYVYHLRDPADGQVFYVGKGKGLRAWTHARDAHYYGGNGAKKARIRAIHSRGEQVVCEIVAEGLKEGEAFQLERRLIREQRPTLTNIVRGTRTERQRSRDDGAVMLERLIPFDRWLARRPRSASEQVWYHRLKAEMEKMARDGWVSTYVFVNGKLQPER